MKVNALSYAQLVLHMLDGTLTNRELAEATGLHYLTVCHYTKALHKAGACHIVAWEQDARGRDVTRIYRIGPGRDAKRSTRSRAEISAAYKRKRKSMAMANQLAGAMT